ncbi:glycerol kinase [Caulobacter sp. AP07]|uniref:glycerol kinase GlpK n=1 Tax=Caulobacter sp. AP07 TaxID=1144304 RepID=UPI000271DA4D|nr:glycerol kinase GlpK [Caulobacter sp. AP07]EJL26604.1 glycerol kinase [Caulobacter sp. AP07]
MSRRGVVAIDQGTTSTRAIRFGPDRQVQATASRELASRYPRPGWVEQDPEVIWADALATLREVVTDDVAAIGLTNQRETIVLWDRKTGKPLHDAIVWQDRRTAELCADLIADGLEPEVRAKTGLLLDPYFSATKLCWLLDTIEGARARAERGELAAGTIDSFLLWRLTGGAVHATDVTNAARTLLYDIGRHRWDEDLAKLFDIPLAILPEVRANAHLFGETDLSIVGRRIPIAGMAGDQQAALIGQGCFRPGMAKSTYGTGCFLLTHIGGAPTLSSKRLLTTPAYRIGDEDAYAMEGSIFIAGAAIKWLRDRMGLIGDAAQTAALAASVPAGHGVHLVPAFVGLGAPHWRTDVRATISGMTLDTGAAHIARAALEAVAYQTCDLVDTMTADGIAPPALLRIDGGMAANDWFAQYLADMLDLSVERPANHETTALGAAYLAGLTTGLWSAGSAPSQDPPPQRFEPRLTAAARSSALDGWRAAVRQVLAA